MRIGIGFDTHRVDPQRPLVLGGVAIPEGPGLAGHSDADVLLHAITDALLGALGEPNLGELFPNTEPQYRGCASRVFVEEAQARLTNQGYRIVNIDAVLIAEQPRLSPHKAAILASLQALLRVGPRQVNVKATTPEGLGALGQGQGMAAHAVALIERSGA